MTITQNVQWEWVSFEHISPAVLYQLLQLRAEVFIVEQRCAYQDLDGKDATALHLLGWVKSENGVQLAASARLLFPQYTGKLSFGRVVVAACCRGLGYGECLIAEILNYLKSSSYQHQPIIISAQYYLVKFYAKFGFQTVGETYDEDGILHIKMVRYPIYE